VTTDILIIGGGVIGLSIARELQRAGVRDITIVDQGTCGREASWAAAGMLSPQAETHEAGPFLDLCLRSRDLYPGFAADLLQETGVDIELDTTGTLALAFDDTEAEHLLGLLNWQRAAGLEFETMIDEHLAKAEPNLPATATMGLLFPNDWQVDNRKLVAALRRYADLDNTKIRENTAVESLIVDGNAVVGARTSEGDILAGTTILATGAWTSLIKLGTSEMPVKVEPVRGQIVCVEARVGTLTHVVTTSRGYLVPRRDGRILVGSTTEHVGFDRSTTEEAISMLTALANDILHAVPLRVVDSWAGLRPATPDGLPVLGGLAGLDGIMVATGHYRNGILLAPLTGKLVANSIVTGGEDAAFREFGPERFATAAFAS
jgi:glycine oxidase